MKHSIKIVLLLLGMFLITQIIGLAVVNIYYMHNDNIPYGMSPPENVNPTSSLFSIVIAIGIAVVLMLLLMKFRTELFLRLWFFVVIVLALGITINAAFLNTPLANLSIVLGFFVMGLPSFISALIALPVAYIKVFGRNLLMHNLTELLIYPGIAVIFVPLLSIWTVILLLILISAYDIYAVWHAGFMQKMAKYQIQNLKVFSGFFIPYMNKKGAALVKKLREKKGAVVKNIKVNLAILGGGDVVFPIILAGVVLREMGTASALIVSLGATLALAFLFYISKKGKFYPAMPFISAGCFIALGAVYLLQYLF
jgi:presenilin-like A22 family membrane protease